MEVLKRLARSVGYEVRNLDSRVEIDCAWGPNVLLYALRDLAESGSKPLKIVQIGAHDGSDQDPLQPFLTNAGCDAILIEPMDEPFTALAARYAGDPRIRTLQVAIGEEDGLKDMHFIVNQSGEPDLTLFSSFDRSTVEANLRRRKAGNPHLQAHRIETKSIRTRTLKSVVEEFEMQDLDAVVVDAEGFDHRIVSSFLNDGVEPKIIRFEYCNLSRRDFEKLRALLLSKEYEIVRVGIDIYCQKTGLLR